MDSSGGDRTQDAAQYRDGGNLRARLGLHERYGTEAQGWFRFAFGHLPSAPEQRVLELGSGTGRLWLANGDRIPTDWRVMVTDLSEGMLDEARLALAGHRAFSFRHMDAQSISFEDDAFDVVVANHMLYHVPDLDLALREVRRVLRSGGTFVAATNGADHMKELAALARSALPTKLAELAARDEQTRRFRLENGAEILMPWFEHIERFDASSPLVVPDAEPLVAYLASVGSLRATLAATPRVERDRILHDASARLAARIERLGPVRITRSTGLFVSR